MPQATEFDTRYDAGGSTATRDPRSPKGATTLHPVPGLPLIPDAAHRTRRRQNLRRHWIRSAARVSALIVSDVAVFLVLRSVMRVLRGGVGGEPVADLASRLFPAGFLGGWHFAVTIVIACLALGTYRSAGYRRDSWRLFTAAGLAALMTLYPSAWSEAFPRVVVQFLSVTVFLGAALSGSRLVLDRVVRRIAPSLSIPKAILVLGASPTWPEGGRRPTAANLEPSLRFVSWILAGRPEDLRGEASVEALAMEIARTGADTVVVSGKLGDDTFGSMVDTALANGCRILTTPKTPGLNRLDFHPVWSGGSWLIELTAPSLRVSQLLLKRGLDIVGSLGGLLVLGPVMLVLAIWIRIDSNGKAIFAQERLGMRGKSFRCFKFRTMCDDAEAVLLSSPELFRVYVENDYKLPEEIDPRITRAGRFLRKTSLDELPQLLNVLRGDMSLVGPRPIVPQEIEHYREMAPLFLALRPGITGRWAISGRSHVGYPDRADLELDYVRHWSLGTDIAILFRTIPAVVRRRGAF